MSQFPALHVVGNEIVIEIVDCHLALDDEELLHLNEGSFFPEIVKLLLSDGHPECLPGVWVLDGLEIVDELVPGGLEEKGVSWCV